MAVTVAVSDAVVVEQVHVAYGSTPALDGVDLRVAPGGTLAVLGHNGAGKTTLIRVMTTSRRPDRGRVVIDGVDAIEHPDEVRRRIGVTGQYAGLDDFLTTLENLELIGRLAGLRARPEAAPGISSTGSSCTASPTAGWASCRAGHGAESISPPAWSPHRPSCSSTSPPPGSTPPPVRRCGRWSPSSPPPAPRWCSPPNTSKRPTGSPTTWSSSTTAASPPRARRPNSRA